MRSNNTFSERLIPYTSEILTALGISFRQSGNWLSSPCIVHGGDNSYGLGVNVQTGRWKCFTHGCHLTLGSNIFALVKAVKQFSDEETLEWLRTYDKGLPRVGLVQTRKEDKIYPEVCLKRLFKTDFYLKRGFTQETLNCFEHGQAESGKLRKRVVFPIRDDRGMMRGFSGRWAGRTKEENGKVICVSDSGKEVPKWKHISFNKSQYLYNYSKIKEECDFIVVVESIGNVMRWHEVGIHCCVACLGSSLSVKQAQLLMNKTSHAILAFDNDAAGKKATQQSLKMLEQYLTVSIITPPDSRDWAELSNEEVKVYAVKCKL